MLLPRFHGGNTGSNPVGDAIQFKRVSLASRIRISRSGPFRDLRIESRRSTGVMDLRPPEVRAPLRHSQVAMA
jgi:hypothetical protein